MAEVNDWVGEDGHPDDWAAEQAAPGPAQPGQQSLTQSPAQIGGWQRYPALIGSAAAHGLAVGLGLPGDMEQAGMRYLVNPVKQALGYQPEDAGKTVFPTSGQMVDYASRAGMTNRADLTPGWGQYPEAERLGTAAISGAATAIPQALMGGRPVATLVAGAGGGAAGEATSQALPGNTLAPLAAGAIPGLATAGLARTFAGDPIKGVAKELGLSETWQDAGKALQGHAKNWLENPNEGLHQAEDQVWSQVDQALKGPGQPFNGPPVALNTLRGALTDITSKGGTLSDAVKALRPGLPDKLSVIISKATTGTTPSWDDVRELRSAIGAASSNPKIAADIGPKNIEKMYAAVTDDLSRAANANGAGAEFQWANGLSSQLRSQADQHIRPLIDKGISPEKAASSVMAGAAKGGSAISAVRAAIPDAVDELASAHLLQTPSGWAKLAPEAKAALVPDAGQRARVETAVRAAMDKTSAGAQALHALVGGGAGYQLGVLGQGLLPHAMDAAGHMSPIFSQMSTGATGELLGMMAPAALRGIGAVVRNPRNLGLPVAGVSGAANALFPGPQPGQR